LEPKYSKEDYMTAKFEIKKAVDGSFYFHLKATNGQIILASETYSAKSSAENGIDSVKVNAPMEERYERKSDVNGKPYFVLKAGNDQVIGKSQMYASLAEMEQGIASVKINGPDASVEDFTASKSAGRG
jgi:uncharacterized protein YegP (UPF0339 family)